MTEEANGREYLIRLIYNSGLDLFCIIFGLRLVWKTAKTTTILSSNGHISNVFITNSIDLSHVS